MDSRPAGAGGAAGPAVAEGSPPPAADAAQELLPLAREQLAREVRAARVPPEVEELAQSLIWIDPPLQQWKV